MRGPSFTRAYVSCASQLSHPLINFRSFNAKQMILSSFSMVKDLIELIKTLHKAQKLQIIPPVHLQCHRPGRLQLRHRHLLPAGRARVGHTARGGGQQTPESLNQRQRRRRAAQLWSSARKPGLPQSEQLVAWSAPGLHHSEGGERRGTVHLPALLKPPILQVGSTTD